MTNIKLTYDYTLSSIKVVSESIDKINTKLAVVLTLSGVLVNFGKDLPGYSINNDIRDIKASRLDWAIRSIASAVILLGLDEILTISIPVMQEL